MQALCKTRRLNGAGNRCAYCRVRIRRTVVVRIEQGSSSRMQIRLDKTGEGGGVGGVGRDCAA